MFKFIHAADIHLDSPMRGLSRYESAPVSLLKGATRSAFKNLVDLAIEEKVDFVVIAGDLYDGDWKDYSTGIFLSSEMGRLKSENISVYIVYGNHDAENKMTKSLIFPDNVHVFSSKKPERFIIDELQLTISGRSFPESAVSGNFAAEYEQGISNYFNIGILHTSLNGGLSNDSYAPCSVNDLSALNFQYWALGHVHSPVVVKSENPWIVFPGCTQGRHIRETGVHGCNIVTVDDGSVTDFRTVPLDVVRWSECRVDISECATLNELTAKTAVILEDALDKSDNRMLAVRIIFEGKTPLYRHLVSDSDFVTSQIRSVCASIAGDMIWLEKVILNIHDKVEMTYDESSPLGAFVSQLGGNNQTPEELSLSDAEELNMLMEIIETLKSKLPSGHFGLASPLNLNDEEVLKTIVKDARTLLGAMILGNGGEK
ncbi:MAG: DNA repair exonuclease [Deltaproteobacteria bacterium]|nr:DNA repair exonuclease [Deltaproteobacteria bacterium]